MTAARSALLAGLGLLSFPLTALAQLDLPGNAVVTATVSDLPGSRAILIGPFASGAVPVRQVEGDVTRTAWHVAMTDPSTLGLLGPLRDQLAAQGFVPLFECETNGCGGFDFRYAADLFPEPDMHVDLGDFRYFAAQRGEGADAAYAELWVSRSAESGFVQITSVLPSGSAPPVATGSTKTPADGPFADAAPAGAAEFAQALERDGAVALDDLVFETGSAELEDEAFASLRSIAAYLAAHPDRSVTLVGHTDALGPLEVNIALSQKRAQSVQARLVTELGVKAGQVTAQGVGYLAPRASNLTEDGRQKNRRVEVILTSTQ